MGGWEPVFGAARPGRLGRAADAVCRSDAEAVRRVRSDLESAATERLSGARPAHGALLVNLHDILEATAPVAAAQTVRVRARSRYG